jgi:HTH-type transcriptional regulator/antitoxin HipB
MSTVVRTSGQLGPILKRLRKEKGWSQQALGNKVGLSQERISVIENHPEKVSLDSLLTVLMALEVEMQIAPKASGIRSLPKENW